MRKLLRVWGVTVTLDIIFILLIFWAVSGITTTWYLVTELPRLLVALFVALQLEKLGARKDRQNQSKVCRCETEGACGKCREIEN